ncbi:hypothetical protein BDZ94DRAFT_32864 [Collybia nuda]|uniref:Uncharacterized protein n=1 Tax=Collybia nuda TaxID=64659 RepID=A0A9P5YJE5_9AGAR|nr:hypothetical protein BDZ94DRAFT_32864 [Collybia nuda]
MHRSSPSSSPLSSPVRKRQRLSSPTYDDQLDDISPEDIEAFDALDAMLSQSPQKNSQSSIGTKDRRAKAITEALSQGLSNPPRPLPGSSRTFERATSVHGLADDPDNPFTVKFMTFKPASTPSVSTLEGSGFLSASGLLSHNLESPKRSPSPGVPPEQDFDSWFQPTSSLPPVAFQTAKATVSSSTMITPGLSTGFRMSSNKGWIAPSSSALAKAQEKMDQIWKENESELNSPFTSTPILERSENLFKSASNVSLGSSPRRVALRALDNSVNTPGTPTPASFLRPSIASALISTPTAHIAGGKTKQFKSPLLSSQFRKNHGKESTSETTASTSPLHYHSRPPVLPTFASAGSQHPLASTPITASPVGKTITPITMASFTTPARTPGTVQRIAAGPKRNTPAPFITPFKPGMKPGQAGRLRLEASLKTCIGTITPPDKPDKGRLTWEHPGGKNKRIEQTRVFDLSIPPNRKTLESSGLLPQQFFTPELESLGM